MSNISEHTNLNPRERPNEQLAMLHLGNDTDFNSFDDLFPAN